MKKFLLLICILFSMHNLWAIPGFSGGSGTSGDPYQIVTPTDLNTVRSYLGAGKYFKLMNDIDLTSYLASGGAGYTAWGALGWLPIGDATFFSGNFNGNGKKISGLTINRPSTSYIGLFGGSEAVAVISNLGVVNVNITGGSGGYTSGLLAFNRGTVSNCYSTGNIIGAGYGTGGLVGGNYGTINQSYSTASVSVSLTAGTAAGGGLVGQSRNGATISNCYSTGSVTRPSGSTGVYYGGLVGMIGFLVNKIEYSYSTGRVFYTGSTNPTDKGFLGYQEASGTYTYTNNFWDMTTSGQTTTGGAFATGKTTADMKSQSTYTGWDFTGIWTIKSGATVSYPYLRNNIPTPIPGEAYTLTYTAGANGTISGTTPQSVLGGADGTEVTAVPDAGYHFVDWSDASTANPRTDLNITANLSVTANFAVTPPLEGPYTVGEGGDYTTLDDVVADLGAVGVSGEVTLNLDADATYTGTLTISHIPGNSATNRLIIKSADPLHPATILGASGKADEPPLTLNGEDFVVIQDLNFTNNSTVAGTSAILFNNGTKNKTINHCTIKAGSNNIETYGIRMGDDCDNNVISNNTILKTIFGIYVDSSISVTNNLQITGNDVGSLIEAETIGQVGITLYNCNNSIVTQNKIHDFIVANDGTGIIIGSGMLNNQITRNNIYNIGSVFSRGITVSTGEVNCNVTIANNMISAIGSVTSRSIYGIYVDTHSGVNIWYNTVNLTGTLTSNVNTITVGLVVFVNSDVDLRNNILINTINNTNYAEAHSYAIYSGSPAASFTNIDYNDYYVSGVQGILGVLNDAVQLPTFAAWQAATGQDTHSQNHDVLFSDPQPLPGQLQYQRVPFNQCLFNTGTAAALTATDFYGLSRLEYEASDIGAYEMPFNSDVAENAIPQTTSLSQNYPNPFNPETAINFALAKDAKVNLTVYNVKGEVVKSLVNSNLKAGYHCVNFNATGLNSGVYVYKMTTNENSFTKKMILVK